jgi:F-type H+-transporting ATPase subunit a
MTEVILKVTTLISDPLEQFEVFNYKYLFLTNLHLYALGVCGLICFLLFFFGDYPECASNKPNIVLFRDKTFYFIADLIKENLNVKAILFFPVIYLTFLFILLANLIGMIPYSFTVTSSAAVTFFFSITFFVGITLVGYTAHKDTLFQILLPSGVPLIIAPFLILVEAVSYFARVFSLGIRLFANMMSGHGLLKILGSFVWAMLLHSFHPLMFYIFPLAIVLVVTLLELAIAFLQAYVFIVLVSVYLNDVICIH